MPRLRIAAVLLVVLLASGCRAPPALHDGDIVFQTSRSAQSLAIQRATHSPYSHMGVVLHRDGQVYVFEAVSPVRFTPLSEWIARGVGGRFTAKRLKEADRVLTPAVVQRMHATAAGWLGRPYDLQFGWSDQRMYCSELVWKLYDRVLGLRVGALQKLGDFDLSDPAVRQKLRERYGNDVPMAEPVISPGAMFDSPLFETVVER